MSSTFSSAEAVRVGFRQIEEDVHKMNGFTKKLLATILCGTLALTMPLPAIAQDAEVPKESGVEIFESSKEEQPSEMALAKQDLQEQDMQAGDESAGDLASEPVALAETDSDITPTPGWELFGTCEWQVDEDGCLTIRPTQNTQFGVLPQLEERDVPPWAKQVGEPLPNPPNNPIKRARIEGSISAANSLRGFFSGLSNLETIDGIENINASSAESMTGMFANCCSLKQFNVSKLDTSNTVSMDAMFYNCQSIAELDVSSFVTSNVSNMSFMFYGCSALSSFDARALDTSNVTDMTAMFASCSSLTNLDVSTFDTSNVTQMGSMFGSDKIGKDFWDEWGDESSDEWDEAYLANSDSSLDYNYYKGPKLTKLDLSNFDTSSVMNMGGMFAGCSKLVELNLSSFNTSNVIYMGGMFEGCEVLREIDVSNFDTEKVESMWGMFSYCASIKSLDLSSFRTPKLKKIGKMTEPQAYSMGMFYGCISLESLIVNGLDTTGVETGNSMWGPYECVFDGCDKLKHVTLGPKCTLQVALPDKTWYNTKGQEFTPATIPVGVADTYRTFKTAMSISISDTAKTVLASDGPFTLTATVVPTDSFNGAIAWSSSDTSVATVDASGVVTPLKVGTTVVRASAGGMSAQCLVTVTEPNVPIVPVNSITLSSEVTLTGKSTAELSATVLPENATYKAVAWSSSNEKVVRVDSKGMLTAVSKGSATITATSQDGRVKASCQVTVLNPATRVSVEAMPMRFEVGSSYTLKAKFTGDLPGEVEAPDGIEWKLANHETATITGNGAEARLSCVSAGGNTLTVEVPNGGRPFGFNAIFDVQWPDPDTLSISETTKSVIVGSEPFVLTATVTSAVVSGIPVTWSSSDTSVAEVDQRGRVTVLRQGRTTVTAQAGNKSAQCAVTVEGRSLPASEDSEFQGFVMATDSATAAKLDGLRVRISKSERAAAEDVRYAAIVSSGNNEAIYVDAFDIDLVDAAGNVRPWNEPGNSLVVYVAMDDYMKQLFAERQPGIHFIADDAATTEAKNTWVEGANIAFETTHFSTYALTATPKPVEPEGGQGGGAGGQGGATSAAGNQTRVGSLVNSGDLFGVAGIAFGVVALLAAAAGLTLFLRRRSE